MNDNIFLEFVYNDGYRKFHRFSRICSIGIREHGKHNMVTIKLKGENGIETYEDVENIEEIIKFLQQVSSPGPIQPQ